MKRMFTLILTVITCTLCIILSIQICDAKTVLHLNECGTVLDVFRGEDENIFVLSEYNNNYKLTNVQNNLSVAEKLIDINVNNSTYAYADNTFYFFYKEKETENGDTINCTIIDSYNYITGVRRKRKINYADPDLSSTFAIDTSGNYYMTFNDKVQIYTSNYEYLKTINTNNILINLRNSDDREIIFCTGYDELTVIGNNKQYSFDIYSDRIFPESDGFFAASSGDVYRFANGNVTEIYNGFNGSYGAAVIGDWVFGNKSDMLTAVNINTEKEVSITEIGSDSYICSLGNSCACITQNGNSADIEIFNVDDLKENEALTIENEPADPVKTESDVYNIDYSENFISGVQPGSTVASIRNNMQGGTFVFYDSKGYVKTSGKIGTGNYIENVDTGERFYILIYGELSSEGNINSSDKKALVNHLLNKQPLDGLYLKAADIDGDSQVSLKDYVALDSYLKGEYRINQNR